MFRHMSTFRPIDRLFTHSYWFLILIIIFTAPSNLPAQGSGSSLSGLVTDNSQAVVPAATVKLRHLSTNVINQTLSDAAGYYRFPSLSVGEYEVSVDHPGFAQASLHIQIETAQHARQDFTLAVAGSTKTLTVEAAPSMLSPDDASIGTTVDNTTVELTPLYLRNWDDLLRLVP